MSHFSTIKTELRNLNAVAAALRRLGIPCELGGEIEDYFHAKQTVDIVAHLPGQRPVGFVRDEGTGVVSLVGDWWGGSTGREEFLSQLKSNYAREQVLASLEQQGVRMEDVVEREEPDGSYTFEVPLDDGQMETMIGG
jgi:hypothetical protein